MKKFLIEACQSDDWKLVRVFFGIAPYAVVIGLFLGVLLARAIAYDLKNLSTTDLLTIGRGLDKLPREDTDREHGDLYNRIQTQISTQEYLAANAAAKALRDKITAEIRAKEAGEQKHE